MKFIGAVVSLVLIAVLMTGCTGLGDLTRGTRAITPSDVRVTEARDVSGFSGIDVHTFGELS